MLFSSRQKLSKKIRELIFSYLMFITSTLKLDTILEYLYFFDPLNRRIKPIASVGLIDYTKAMSTLFSGKVHVFDAILLECFLIAVAILDWHAIIILCTHQEGRLRVLVDLLL